MALRENFQTGEVLTAEQMNAITGEVNQISTIINGGITNIYNSISSPGSKKGDIAIVTTTIAQGHNSYSAYIWNGTAWQAMDGNYNAENVYFDENILITTAVGNITLTNGQGIIPAQGKNLKQVLEALWTSEDLNPDITNPSISLSISSNASGEVGDTFTRPTATLKIEGTGSYQYGSKNSGGTIYSKDDGTGISFTNLKVGLGTSVSNLSSSNATIISQGAYGKNHTITYTATQANISNNLFTDSPISYSFCASGATSSTPRKPVTNLGNFIDSSGKATSVYANGTKQIPARTYTLEGSNAKTWTATGYRRAFAGGTANTTIDSAVIRGVPEEATKNSQASMNSQTKALEFSAAKGTTKVFFAYPTKWSGTPYFEMFGLAWAENINFVKKSNVQVADARGGNNGLTYYNLYVWELDTPLAADSTRFRVWFK